MSTQPEYCERCRRPAPPVESTEYVHWEAIELAGGDVRVICPGCVTATEQRAIDDDTIDVLDEIARSQERGEEDMSTQPERCSRCRTVAPPPAPGPGGAAAEGWVYREDEDGRVLALVCPNCATLEDVDESWPDTMPKGWE